MDKEAIPLEIVEARHKVALTIFYSQIWHTKLGNEAIAKAVYHIIHETTIKS